MDKAQSLIVKKYLDLFYRWKLLVILLLLLSLPTGLAYYILAPKTYMASSLLSYQQEKVSPNRMSPDVEAQIRDILGTLSQIVTSRTNLEDIIETYDLFSKAREELPLEDVIDIMREQILIEPSTRGDIFSISFSGGDPDKVVKVTNALSAKFIEENLKYRQERATETSAYTSNELQMAKETMDRKEAAMRDYKLKYYNEMPQQRQTNVSRLASFQGQYQSKQESILELERTRVLIQQQIAAQKNLYAAEKAALANEIAAQANRGTSVTTETRPEYLARMRLTLDNLLVKYTENHPEVKRTRRIISNLEKEIAAEGRGQGGRRAGRSNRALAAAQADILELEAQLKNIESSAAAIEVEKQKLDAKIVQYEKWIAATPVREAEWSALTREYDQLKSHYDYLVSQDLQAKSMLNLERQQRGSQFKIEDPARYPEKPIKPDFLKIMIVAIGGALGLGAGCVLLIDFFDGSFRDPEEVEPYLGVPVVSTIALLPTPAESRKQKLLSAGVGVVLAGGCVVITGLFWFTWSRGLIVM